MRGSGGNWLPSFGGRFFQIFFSVLCLGYLFILYTVVVKDGGSSAADQSTASQLQADLYERKNIQQQKEIRELRNQLALVQSALEEKKDTPKENPDQSVAAVRPGVIILGMHRSGTSALGGLINKMGLKTGGPLIRAAEDNEKGFFERIDVVLQDDYLMQRQRVHYSVNTYKYDALAGIKDIINDDGTFFKEGKRGLAFLNNKENYPWMLKDPRLCITLRTWLPFLNFIPAVLFTYRHPMDVALSMSKREFEKFAVNKGLRLWYVYNKRAIEQSQDLCRVTTSHRKVMQQPKQELDRIFDELVACGVAVPHKLDDTEISSFIDIKLQHGKSTLKDHSCDQDLTSILPPESWPTKDDQHIRLYREVMRVYCAMEDGRAFQRGFQFADFVKDN